MAENEPVVIAKTRVVLDGGLYFRIRHASKSTSTDMTFGMYLPSTHPFVSEAGDISSEIPVLFWLSGLTCDDTNFAIKAGPKAFECAEKNVRQTSLFDENASRSTLPHLSSVRFPENRNRNA